MKQYKEKPKTKRSLPFSTIYDNNLIQLKRSGYKAEITNNIIINSDLYLFPIINNEGKIGFINSYAEVVIEPQYDSYSNHFINEKSLIAAKDGSKSVIIDSSGHKLFSMDGVHLEIFKNRFVIIHNKDYQVALYDFISGEEVIPFGKYSTMEKVSFYDYLLVGFPYGIIDEYENIYVPQRYSRKLDIVGGFVRVVIRNTKDGQEQWGIVNLKGDEVVPVNYDSASCLKITEGEVYSVLVKDGKSSVWKAKEIPIEQWNWKEESKITEAYVKRELETTKEAIQKFGHELKKIAQNVQCCDYKVNNIERWWQKLFGKE